MVMINIRGLLDYYKDELTFHQIIGLYMGGDIKLKNGYATESELTIIIKKCDLDNIDIRKIEPQKEISQLEKTTIQSTNLHTMTSEELSNYINILEKDNYHLQKKISKKSKQKYSKTKKEKIKNAFGTLVRLSEAYEFLYNRDNDQAYLEKAIRNRQNAERIYESATTISEKRARANNLLKLGECILIKTGKKDINYLLKSKELFEEILSTIRNSESRLKADENAKIGIIYLNLYYSTGNIEYLTKSEKILSDFEKYAPNKKDMRKHFIRLKLKNE